MGEQPPVDVRRALDDRAPEVEPEIQADRGPARGQASAFPSRALDDGLVPIVESLKPRVLGAHGDAVPREKCLKLLTAFRAHGHERIEVPASDGRSAE